MDKKLKSIIETNNKFYLNSSKEFSESRQYPWKGWVILLNTLKSEYLTKKSNKAELEISVLDLGCGNARFYDFLNNNLTEWNVAYTGMDNNEQFLNECRNKFPNARFIKKDLISSLGKEQTNIARKSKYDLVVCFGVTHHIPNELIVNYLQNTVVYATKYVVFSFWNELPKKAYLVETGHYIDKWNNDEEKLRHIYVYNKENVDGFIKILKDKFKNLSYNYSVYNSDKNIYLMVKKD